MKIHRIAYSHNPDQNKYIVFKECGGIDCEIASLDSALQAESWIKEKYIKLGSDENYDFCLPFNICTDKPN
jgi:hypothetical protein